MTTQPIPNVSSLTPLEGERYQYRACPRCNGVFRCSTGNAYDLCQACQTATKLPKIDKRKHVETGNGIPFTLTYDPTGDFPAGSTFDVPDFAFSLLTGVWPIGAIFERDGSTYTVTGIGEMVDQDGRPRYATTQRIRKTKKREKKK
jgi:hypothetical protein